MGIMQRLVSRKYRYLLILAILVVGVFDVLAFTRQWREEFGSGMGAWGRYRIGSCGGQNHYTSGGQLHMRARYGTDCFGAYYRREDHHPGTFPRTEDIRVMWRWRYTNFDKWGTQAGQVTGNWGWPQYYGMSAVDTGNGDTNDYHVLTDGNWGSYQVDNPLYRRRDTNWHVSTFDWICDGVNMKWWLDSSLIHQRNSSAYYLPPNHESRPFQFWMGNLLTDVPSNGNWTQFDLDYVYVYAVQRPQMNTPVPGSAGTQTVTWNTVPNTTQPDGSTWDIQYQVRVCGNANCSSVRDTSPWQSGTSYTFNGLPLQRTYYYQTRARWVGTPALTTCWGNTVSAEMSGEPELSLSKTATVQQEPGGIVQYSLTLANIGDAPAYGVAIRDPIPTGIIVPSGISGGGSVSGDQIVWTVGTLNAGASVTVNWQGTIDLNIPRSVSQITNTATATDNAGHSDTAQASTTVLMPDMTLSKSATSPVWPGRDIDFTINVESSGQGSLRNIIIRDPIPPYVIDVTNISDGGSVAGDEIVWTFTNNMPPGTANSLSWRGTIDEGSLPETYTQLVNTVNGTASTGVDKSTHSTSQVLFPHMSLAKYAPPRLWPTGSFGSFVYTMTVTNDGDAIMYDPVIRDPIPSQYVINIDNISGGGSRQGNEIVWTPNDLEPGDAVELSWEFGLDPLIPTDVTEQINTIYGTAGWWAIDESATAISEVGRPIMRLTKIAPTQVWPNAPISYTILVENTGNAPMYQSVITDTIPDYVTELSGISHSGDIEGEHIVWRLPDQIPGGGRVVLSWHGVIDPNIPRYETEIVNAVSGCALVTCDTTETSSVLVYPAMYLAKSAPPRSSPGKVIEFVVTVRNAGQAPMYDVVITDPVPDHILSPDVPAGTVMGGNVVWEFPVMMPGETQSLSWSGTIDDNTPNDYTTLINKVYGTALSGISAYAETTTVMLYPTMNLNKWATPEVWPGSTVEYRITVQNTGGAVMEDVQIRDRIPDYVLNATNISGGGTIDRQDIIWELGDMAPGASFELTWEGTVDPYIPTSRNLIRNQVQGTAARGVSDVAEATSLVLFPSLVINKGGTSEAAPGDTVQFVIEVHNASAAPVEDVVVKDFIPDYINDPANLSYNGRVEGKEIIWEIGSMTGGESLSLAWEGTIDLSVPLGQKYIDNEAEICDGLQRFCDNALYRLRLLQADARVIKNATPYGWPGSEVEYTITVQNTGETTLQEVIIRDPLPEHVLYPREISHSGTVVESPFEGEIEIVWGLADLAPGDWIQLSWQGTIARNTPVKVDAIENKAILESRRGLLREGIGSTYVMHPELRLLKRATAEARPGEQVDYSITLENPGWIPAYEVEVHDIIPTYILSPTDASNGGEIWADEVYWHFDTLAAGQVITLTWAGTVDPEVPISEEEIINTVRAADMTGVEAETQAVTDLVIQDIIIRKTASYAVQPGGDIAYTIEAENRSDAPITGITITDPVPEYVLDPRNISDGGLFDGNTQLIWELAVLNPGQSLSLSWRGTVDKAIPAGQQVIWNEAQLATESGLQAVAKAKSFVDHPRLNIDKMATLEAGPSEPVSYTLVLKNLGRGPSYDVEVHDPIPAYLTDSVISGEGVIQADEVYWGFDEMQPGEVVTLTWSATVDRLIPPTETDLVNTARVIDASGNTDMDQAVTDLLAQRIQLIKDATPVVYPGGEAVYTITVRNRGEAMLYDLTVTDPIPEYILDARHITGGAAGGNANVVWEVVQLAPGQMMTFSWTGTVDPEIPIKEQTIWNDATVTTGGKLAATARARSLVRYPILTVDKWATLMAGPGEMVDYLVTVKNNGQAPAYGVEVYDPMPPYIVNVTSGDATEVRADAVYWFIDVLPPGEERILNWNGEIDEAIPATETQVVNTVTVQDTSGNTDQAQATTNLPKQALFIDKRATAEIYPGGPVGYTIILENRGETTLYNVNVTDPVPTYVLAPQNISAGGRLSGNTEVVWEVPAMAVGQVMTLTWQGTVDRAVPAKVADIWNEATVTTAGGLEAKAEAKSWITHPSLAVVKQATVEAGPGEAVAYTVIIGNSGQAPAYGVEVHDPIPPHIVSPGGAAGGEIRADEIYWYFDILQPGETRTLSWSGFVDPDIPPSETTIVNTVSVRDVAGGGDQAQAVTNLPGHGVTMAKSGTYLVYPGGDVVYTITVENRGDATLYGIVVRDPAPEHVLNPRDISAGGALDGNVEVVWSIPSLPAGQTAHLTWRGTVDQATPAGVRTIWNEATLMTESGLEAAARAKSWVSHPALTVEKSATIEAGPGEQVTYTLLVRNSGQAPAYGVEVHDPIPLHIVSPGDAAGGQIRADEIYWYFENLQPGEERALSWTGYIDAAIPPGVANINNTVTVQDMAGNQDQAQAVTNLVPQRIDIAKSATYQVYPGGDVVYTITVRNRGNAELYGVTVTDPVPEYILTPSDIGGGGALDGNTAVIWELPALTAGQMVTLTWQGTVDRAIPAKVRAIWNEATLVTESGLQAKARARSFVRQPSLRAHKEVAPSASPGPGDRLDYTITLENPSQAVAYGVEVHDPIPAYIVNAAGGEIRADELFWFFDNVAPGQVITLSWSGEIAPDIPASQTKIINTVSVWDVAGNGDEAQAITNLGAQQVDMAQTATYQVYPGGRVVYTTTVKNTGEATLYGLTVTDPLPESILAPQEISPGGRFKSNTEIVWEIPTLVPGETKTLSWAGTVGRSTPSSVTAIWNEARLVTESGLEAAATAKSIVHHPTLAVEKSATIEVGPGEPVDYTITLRNPGLAPAYEVEVYDLIPAYIVDVSGAVRGQIRANEIYWHFDELAPGEERTLSWSGAIDGHIPETTTQIVNRVTVSDMAGNRDQAEAVTTLLIQRIDMAKSGSYVVHPGSDVIYTITVRNRGNAALYGITVTDPVPEYVLDPQDISHSGRFEGNTEIVWEIAALAPGQTRVLTWCGTIDTQIPAKQLSLTNEARSITDGGLAATARARSLVYHPTLVLDKTATMAAGPGEPIDYTLVVENPSQAPAYEVEVHDPIPQHIIQPGVSAGGVVQADAVYWRFDRLEPGRVVTLSWQGTVDPVIPATVEEIANTATVQDATGQSDEDQAVTNLLAQRIDLAKTASYIINPGGDMVYTITVRNRGEAALYGLTVTDPVPEYILNPREIGHGGEFRGNMEVVWELDRLGPGQMLALTWQGSVDPTVPEDVTDIWNEASLTGENGLEAQARARSKILRPALVMVKLAPDAVGPGDTLTYTLIIENAGPVAASNVDLHDPIPAHILHPRHISGGGYVDYLPTHEVRWQLGDLAAGERRALSWAGTVDPHISLDPVTTTVINNVATARDESGQSISAGVKTVILPPRVELVKRATGQVGPGERVDYTLLVTNTGQTWLNGLTVTDPVPDYILDPANINPAGRLIDDEIIWSLGSLDVGDALALTWAGTVDPDIPADVTHLRNRATVTAAPDLKDSAGATTWVLRPAVEIAKTGPAEVSPGGDIAYTLTVTNSGRVTLFDVTVADIYPVIISPTRVDDGGAALDGNLVWSVGRMAAGEVVELTWEGAVTSALPVTVQELRNRATITALARVEAQSWVTTTIRQPHLQLAKYGPASVQPGGELDYRIVVTNTGQAAAGELRLEDLIPTYVTPQAIDDGGYEVPGRIVWMLDDLAPGQTDTMRWRGRVAPDIPATEPALVNVVSAVGAGGIRAEAETTSYLLRPGLTLVKEAGLTAYAGGEITYTLHLANNGDGLARNIEVRDPLPDHVAYVPDSATRYGTYDADSEVITWMVELLGPGEVVEMAWRGQVAIDLPASVNRIINQAEATTPDVSHPVTATVTTNLVEPDTTVSVLCPAQAQAGDVLSYTVRLHNTGGTLPEPEMILPLPAGTTYRSGSASHRGRLITGRTDEWGDPLPDQLLWELDTLAYDDREQVRFALEVSPVMTGHVRIGASIFASSGAVAHGSCETTLFVPALEVTKTGPKRAVVNDIVDYQITVKNTGLVVAHNTLLTDTILPGVDYLPGSASNGVEVVTVEGDDEPWEKVLLLWHLGDLEPGEQVIRSFRGQMYVPLGHGDYQVTFNTAGEAEIYNEVEVTADRATPAFNTMLTLVPRPDLTLTRQVQVETDGTLISYSTLTAVADLSIVGPAVQPLEIDLLNSTESPDVQPESVSAQGSSPVAASTVQVWPGSRVEHTLVGVNVGPGVARQAVLVEQIPTGLEVLADTISDDGYYDPDQHAVIWPLGDLADGEEVRHSYTILVPLSLRPGYQPLDNNEARLTSPDAPTAYASASTSISGTFEVAAAKLATDYAEPGDTIDYLIRVRNISPNPVDQVTIYDPLPEYTTYITGSASLPPAFSLDGRTLSWNLGMLIAGETRDIHFQARLAPDTPDWLLRVQNEVDITFSGGQTTASVVTDLPLPPNSDPGDLPPTPTPDPGDEGGDDKGGDDQPPASTPIPPRSTAVVPPFGAVTPTVTAGPTASPSPTPLPAPGLHLSVSPETVRAGEVSLVTWRLTFSNPTPLLIGDLVVRDLLPQGLLYVGAETSQGLVEVSPRSGAGQDTQFILPSPTPQLTGSPTVTVSQTVAPRSPTRTPGAVTATTVHTATTAIGAPGGELPETLPGINEVPPTEVIFRLGDLPPGGRVQMVIDTLVLSDAIAGTVYDNIGTYAAANMDPGLSDKAAVKVVGRPEMVPALLPVTGGLLELVDPRTRPGQISWSVIGAMVAAGLWLRRRWRRD